MSDVSIKRIQFVNVSGFLVYNENSVILVDTGHKNTVSIFLSALDELGFSPSDLKLIILTHTHFDHAGGAKEIHEITGAPVAVHKNEAEFLRAGRTPFPRGTRWKGKLLTQIGNLFAKGLAKYPSLEADIIIEDSLLLSEYGISGKVIHTPGHTAGSLSVIFDTGQALVGDNVLGISPKEHFPPFANDEKAVLKTWELYIELGVTVVFPAHGVRVYIESLAKELPVAKRKYRQSR